MRRNVGNRSALETYKSNEGSYPAAAGGGSHVAMDLLTGAAATVPSFGTPLESVPADDTSDDAGVVSVNGTNPNGCA